SMKLIEGSNTKLVFVMDTHDGKSYRLMRKSGEIFVNRSDINDMIDPRTSSPRRLEVLNTIMNNVIQSKVVQSPNLFPDERIVWNNVNDKLANQIVMFFREYTKGKGLDYKVLKDA